MIKDILHIDILHIIESYLIIINQVNWKDSTKNNKLKYIKWYYENRCCENYKRINLKRPIIEQLELTYYWAFKYKHIDIIKFIEKIKLTDARMDFVELDL